VGGASYSGVLNELGQKVQVHIIITQYFLELPTKNYPLKTTHYPLKTTHYPLKTTHYPLKTTHYPPAEQNGPQRINTE
jgi:hypothetical protein